MSTYSHLARSVRYACYIPEIRDEPLGFASLASAVCLVDDILPFIQVDLKPAADA
jgi:hypothetical protein